MIIIYDGIHLAKLCGKLKGREVAIFTTTASPQPKEAIYYLEKKEDPEVLTSLPPGWAVEVEEFNKAILLEHPKRIFTKNFALPPHKGDLYVNGCIEAVSSLCGYLLKEYRLCIGLSGEHFRVDSLVEKHGQRLQNFSEQPLHLHLGFGPKEKPHLHLWDGSAEELHRIREHYEQLPRYHALLQWGGRGKHFYDQDLLQGKYLGKINKKGYAFQWRKALMNF